MDNLWPNLSTFYSQPYPQVFQQFYTQVIHSLFWTHFHRHGHVPIKKDRQAIKMLHGAKMCGKSLRVKWFVLQSRHMTYMLMLAFIVLVGLFACLWAWVCPRQYTPQKDPCARAVASFRHFRKSPDIALKRSTIVVLPLLAMIGEGYG